MDEIVIREAVTKFIVLFVHCDHGKMIIYDNMVSNIVYKWRFALNFVGHCVWK